jgi:DNA-binding HxlR family transcriptional regulator
MKNKSYNNMQCPISKCLDNIGEWWSLLIIRDAFMGLKRFDEFQKSLGIATNMLTRRLKDLVESGILEKQQYGESKNRFEYVLTQKGYELSPILITMFNWGNKYYPSKDTQASLVNIETKETADAILIDKKTGLEINPNIYEVIIK